jgi:hypothetical protein
MGRGLTRPTEPDAGDALVSYLASGELDESGQLATWYKSRSGRRRYHGGTAPEHRRGLGGRGGRLGRLPRRNSDRT